MTPSGVRQMITRRGLQAGVDAVVGKAGTGKSTALGAYRAVLDATGIPVIGVAPSATAAHQLAVSAGITDTGTVDRLLTELRHRRRTLPHGVVMIVDEAAMCPTRSRLALQRAVDAVDGKVVDVGDHRQIPSVDVGGDHYALAQRLGATERATVAELNHVARDHLIARGDIARRSRTYRSPDHNHTITLAVGDEVILRRNQRLAQPTAPPSRCATA